MRCGAGSARPMDATLRAVVSLDGPGVWLVASENSGRQAFWIETAENGAVLE